MIATTNILDGLRDRGVTLVAVGTELQVTAPVGTDRARLHAYIVAHKPALLFALTRQRMEQVAREAGFDPRLLDRIADEEIGPYTGFSDARITATLSMLADDRARERGLVPQGDTAGVWCHGCGPVWLSPTIATVLPVVRGWPQALGCPWCRCRALGAQVPRPDRPWPRSSCDGAGDDANDGSDGTEKPIVTRNTMISNAKALR